MSMLKCPKCKGDQKVIDARPQIGYIRRRRVCLDCGYKTTYREYSADEITNWQNKAKKYDDLMNELRESI